jgi:predicted small integral membrane protein
MAWTPVTASFFAALGLTLAVMTVLAIRRPEVERLGVLGIPTTRGDRLFLSLIAAALIHLIWIGVAGADTIATLPVAGGLEISSLWLASGISLATAAVLFRTV